MSTNNAKVRPIIETAFTSAVEKLTDDKLGNLINDLYVQVDMETGELQIYDEQEQLVEKIVIFEWIDKIGDEEANRQAILSIKETLSSLSAKKLFDRSCFIPPFSISLTDETFVVSEELLFIDDEFLRADDPLLKDLDTDLDQFLSKLLSDVI